MNAVAEDIQHYKPQLIVLEKSKEVGEKNKILIDLNSPKTYSEDFNNIELNEKEDGVPGEIKQIISNNGGTLHFSINDSNYAIELPETFKGMKLPWKGNVNIDTIDNLIKVVEGYEVNIKFISHKGDFKDVSILKTLKNEKITKIIQLIDAGSDGSTTKIIFYSKGNIFSMVELEILRKKGN
jgi:hypothetical protein